MVIQIEIITISSSILTILTLLVLTLIWRAKRRKARSRRKLGKSITFDLWWLYFKSIVLAPLRKYIFSSCVVIVFKLFLSSGQFLLINCLSVSGEALVWVRSVRVSRLTEKRQSQRRKSIRTFQTHPTLAANLTNPNTKRSPARRSDTGKGNINKFKFPLFELMSNQIITRTGHQVEAMMQQLRKNVIRNFITLINLQVSLSPFIKSCK